MPALIAPSPVPLPTPQLTPLLKWPGGKRSLLAHLLRVVPRDFNTYHEPFAGGAALFFALSPKRAILSDINSLLIDCYTAVRNEPENVVKALKRLQNSEEHYYWARDEWTPRLSSTKAARLYYLQRLSFNGIYRENRNGEFNVPYAYREERSVYDHDHIFAVSRALKRTRLIKESFASVLDRAAAGDFVYLDPPYTLAHNNNGFIKYNASLYSWECQLTLADVAAELRRRGCYTVISNAYHDSVLRLYREGFRILRIDRHSVIGSKPEYRSMTSEALIVST